MTLTHEQKDKVLEHMKSRGVRGCAACGHDEFNIEGLYSLPNDVKLTKIQERTAVVTSGIWTVIAVCSNCSYVMMFHETGLHI